MSDLLDTIIARSRGQLVTVRPRLPTLFEPLQATALTSWAEAPTTQRLGTPALADAPSHGPAREGGAAVLVGLAHLPDPFSAYPPPTAESSRGDTPVSVPEPPVVRRAAPQNVAERSTLVSPMAALAQQAELAALPVVPFLPAESEHPATFEARAHRDIPEPTLLHQAVASEAPGWIGQPAETARQERPPVMPTSAPRLAQTTPTIPVVAARQRVLEATSRVDMTDQGDTQPAVVLPMTIVAAASVPEHGATLPAASAAVAHTGDAPVYEQVPDVHVTIGRIEVRALHPAPATPNRSTRPAEPALNLDTYLRRQGGGRR